MKAKKYWKINSCKIKKKIRKRKKENQDIIKQITNHSQENDEKNTKIKVNCDGGLPRNKMLGIHNNTNC